MMINIIAASLGGIPLPSPNKFHIFNEFLDVYEHAEFSKDNGDFYQIVYRKPYVYYKFQKEDVIYNIKSDGEWWIYESTEKWRTATLDSFITRINGRIGHNYNIDKMVLSIDNIKKIDCTGCKDTKFMQFIKDINSGHRI